VFRSATATAGAFALLAVLVAVGACAHLDQWGVDHLMPGAHFQRHGGGIGEGAVPLLHAHWHGALSTAANIVTLPASFLIALAVVAWRSRPLAVGRLVAVAVEVVCKATIVRPALYAGPLHVGAFDSSFPSGHALRTVIVAAALTPLVGGWAAVWALASIALLQLAGWHTPTDIAGGVLLGALVLLCLGGARALRARRLRP
jgi:membrane-associated phospholipid phosphatase